MAFPTTNLSMKYVCYHFGHLRACLSTLCTHPDINIWSKYKPLDNNFSGDRPADWWRGRLRHCGIQFTSFSRISELIEAVNSGEPLFTHDAPFGTQASPYRLGDFCGYNPDAVPPIFTSNIEGEYYQNVGEMGVACMLRSDDPNELTVSDVFDEVAEVKYFGAAFQREGTSTFRWMTTTGTVQNGATIMQVPLDRLEVATYRVYFFLCRQSKPDFLTGDNVDNFMAIPGKQGQRVVIKRTNIVISIIAFRGTGTVYGTITVDNQSGEMQTFRNCSVWIRYADMDMNSAFIQGEGLVNLDDFTVPAQTKKSVDYSRTSILPDINRRGGKVYFFTNNQMQAQSAVLMESN